MSTQVFSEEQSVFFVGGRGNKSGRIANAGGCTKAWWDAEVAATSKAEAMAKLMTAVGSPIITFTGASYTVADDRITSLGAFDDAEIGMVVYVIETPVETVDVETGRYKITDVDVGGDWIECDGINGTGDATVDIEIGGAFDELNNACDDTIATSYSVWIHTNLAETLTAAVTIGAGGNNTKNTFKRILGFNTVPGDMDRGGTYYESPFEILLNGIIDSSKTVLIDADGDVTDFEHFDITGDNLIFENLHFYNSADKEAILFSGRPFNIVLRNCRFSDVKSAFNSTADHILVDSCYTHNDFSNHSYITLGMNTVFLNCAGNNGAGKTFINIVATSGSVIGCLVVGGQYGVQFINAGANGLVMNNTFYDTTAQGVRINNGAAVVVLNNIFALATGAVGLYAETTGSFMYNDYNCFIESDGTALTVGSHGSGYEAPVIGPHSIALDPLFVNPADGNFRLQDNSPAFNAGIRGASGGYSVIGGFGPYHNVKNAAYEGDTNVMYGGDYSIYDR